MKPVRWTKQYAPCPHVHRTDVYVWNNLCWDCHGIRLFRLRSLRWFQPLGH